MAYIPRRILLRSRYFKCDNAGVLVVNHVTIHRCSTLKNFESQSLLESFFNRSAFETFKRFTGSLSYSRKKTYQRFNGPEKKVNKFKLGTKLGKLNLLDVIKDGKEVHPHTLRSVFHKLLVFYHVKKEEQGFDKFFKSFVKSWEFKAFCNILDSKLRTLTPECLLLLLNLQSFGVLSSSILMRKVLVLILDNINKYTLDEMLLLYTKLKDEWFLHSVEAGNIRKACEVYFSNMFEDELSHYKNIQELIYYIGDQTLPIEVRKCIAERVFEFTELSGLGTPFMCVFFESVFQEPLLSLLKPKIMTNLLDIVSSFGGTGLQHGLLRTYEKVILNNNELYDENICERFALNACSERHPFFYFLNAMDKLCNLGYYNEALLQRVCNSFLSLNFSNLTPEDVLIIASILVKVCIHEKDPENWEKYKVLLTSYDAKISFKCDHKILKWCEYLTFLGCDTRTLLTHVFNQANADSYLVYFDDLRSLLRLHHLANVSFSNDFNVINTRRLNEILQMVSFKGDYLMQYGVDQLFGSEKYLLKNCSTAERHHLHILVVLGPDNQPIDLSCYKPKNEDKLASIKFSRNFCSFINIENISRPPGSKIIVFQELLDCQFLHFQNVPLMKSGILKLHEKSLQKCDCQFVFMPSNILNFTPEKRLKYLQSELDKII